MKSPCRLFGALLLLCLTSLALILPGCGGSSTSSQPLDITAGTWSITVTPSGGGATGTLTAIFKTFPCSNTNIPLGPTWTIPGPLTTASVCVSASTLSGSAPGGDTPQAMIIGVGANPVPANGTTTMPTATSYFALLDTKGNSDAFDLSGTFTASGKSLTGTYTCDVDSANCNGQAGTLSGTMK